MRHGRRVGGPIVVTHAVLRTQSETAKFGYIVSKKVGNAVVRNRVTRRLKAISDEILREGISPIDVVFRAQPAAATASYQQLREEVFRAVAKLERVRQGQ